MPSIKTHYVSINRTPHILEVKIPRKQYGLREFGDANSKTVTLPHSCTCPTPGCAHILAVKRWQDKQDRLAGALKRLDDAVRVADGDTTEMTVMAAEKALTILVATENE
jgi:hypothetical protein